MMKEEAQRILQRAALSNFLQIQDYLRALKSVLYLDKPLQVSKILQSIIKKHDFRLTDTFSKLKKDQKGNLLAIS